MKKITGHIKLQLPAGKANPSPPVGPALGQHGVNIMAFCKEFNVGGRRRDMIIPVVITVYSDRSFTFITQDAARVGAAEEGSRAGDRRSPGRLDGAEQAQGRQGHRRSRSRSWPQQKMQDMNSTNLEAAMRSIAAPPARWASTIVD